MAEPERPAGYTRNPHDNKTALSKYFKVTNIVDKIFTKATMLADIEDKMAAIWLIARGDALKRHSSNVPEMTVALAIANGIAPSMALMTPENADTYVAQCVSCFFQSELYHKDFVLVTNEVYASWTRAPTAEAPRAEAGPLHRMRLPATLDQVRGMEYNFSVEQAKAVLSLLLTVKAPPLEQAGMYLYTTAFVAFAKRGEVTSRKLLSIQKQIADNFGLQVELETATVRYVYEAVGRHIPEGHIGVMFRVWAEDVKDLSMRLRVTLEQAAFTGLTQYMTIRKAILEFSTFPWAKVASLLPQEMANFQQALDTVKNDEFYGFRRDLGPAAATKFQSLAWVSKELIRRRGGTEADHIEGFKGWLGTPRSHAALRKLLTDYQDAEANIPIPEDVDTAQAVLRKVVENANLAPQAIELPGGQ